MDNGVAFAVVKTMVARSRADENGRRWVGVRGECRNGHGRVRCGGKKGDEVSCDLAVMRVEECWTSALEKAPWKGDTTLGDDGKVTRRRNGIENTRARELERERDGEDGGQGGSRTHQRP